MGKSRHGLLQVDLQAERRQLRQFLLASGVLDFFVVVFVAARCNAAGNFRSTHRGVLQRHVGFFVRAAPQRLRGVEVDLC